MPQLEFKRLQLGVDRANRLRSIPSTYHGLIQQYSRSSRDPPAGHASFLYQLCQPIHDYIQEDKRAIPLHQNEECSAFVFINVESGKDLEVFTKIRELQHKYPILEVATLYGNYDVLVKIGTCKPGDLDEFVLNGLRPIRGIADTKTMISTKSIEFG